MVPHDAISFIVVLWSERRSADGITAASATRLIKRKEEEGLGSSIYIVRRKSSPWVADVRRRWYRKWFLHLILLHLGKAHTRKKRIGITISSYITEYWRREGGHHEKMFSLSLSPTLSPIWSYVLEDTRSIRGEFFSLPKLDTEKELSNARIRSWRRWREEWNACSFVTSLNTC